MDNQVFTDTFKASIKELGLIKSGRLYNETKLSATVTNNNTNINVMINASGPDYLDYITVMYPLVQNWQSKQEVGDEITALIRPIIEQVIGNTVEGKEVPNFGLSVGFTVNNA